MDKTFNWKPYIIFILIFSAIIAVINYRITIGLLIGTIAYFLNDLLLSKKFPRLDSNSKAVGSIILYMFLQGTIIVFAAVLTWFLGKLPCFLGNFAGLTLPTFYYLILRIFKK